MREDRIVTAQQPQGAPNTTGSVSPDGPDPYRATQGANVPYIIEVDSSDPKLPDLIGPFESAAAAEQWMSRQPGYIVWGISKLANPSTLGTAP